MAKQATTTVPIIMAVNGDAVATGLAQSIARPGGNITGSTFFFPELNVKRLQLIKEAVPRIRRVGILLNPDNPSHVPALEAMVVAAKSLGKKPRPVCQDLFGVTEKQVDAVEVVDDRMMQQP